MSDFPTPRLDRRRLLRDGALALSAGAFLAACGDTETSGEPGRLGVAPPPATLPPAELDDSVLLRTAQSLAYTTIDMYAELTAAARPTGDIAALIEQFTTDHQRHADAWASMIQAAGGEPFTCGNPFFATRLVPPVVDALGTSEDLERDAIDIVFSFESLVAASYQSFVTKYTDATLRPNTVSMCGEVNRHVVAVAMLVNPDDLVSPALFGQPVTSDADGYPILYAIPSTFGQLGPIELVVGGINEEGQRTSLLLQTPAENSYVYAYLSC